MTARIRILLRDFSDFEQALAAEIEAFHRSQAKMRVDAQTVTLHELHEELFVRGGLREGRWDLSFFVTDWLAEAMEEGLLEDLGPYLKGAPNWPAGWPASLTEPVCFGEAVSSLPWHDGPECLIYRCDWFEDGAEREAFRRRYGYDLEPPRTWQQFEDVARFFTRPEESRFGTLVAAYPDGHNTLYDFALQLWSRGGSLEDAAGRPWIESAEAVAALDFYRRLVRDPGMCDPASPQLNSTQSGDLFLSGKIALMVNWFGFAARCDRAGSPLNGKVALAPIPADSGQGSVSLSVFWTLGMARGSHEKGAAWEFLRFAAQPEVDRARAEHGTVPVRLSSWRDEELRRQTPCYREIERISLGARRLPRTRHLAAFAAVIDGVIREALTTQEASSAILSRAQRRLVERGIQFAGSP